MSFADLLHQLKRYDQNAAVIFDAEEPIGKLTDMVLPRRRWFPRARSKALPRSSRKLKNS
jgi:hypothetical protein